MNKINDIWRTLSIKTIIVDRVAYYPMKSSPNLPVGVGRGAGDANGRGEDKCHY